VLEKQSKKNSDKNPGDILKNKTVELLNSRMIDLETLVPRRDSFKSINRLFLRAKRKKALDWKILGCNNCEGMNVQGVTEAGLGYGSLLSKIFIVGQSFCTQCMGTGIPFTEGSGYYIDAALQLSGMTREQIFITNLVHCHPKNNAKNQREWIDNCSAFLERELAIIKPKIVIAFGTDARNFFHRYYGLVFNRDHFFVQKVKRPFNHLFMSVFHPAYYLYSGGKGGVEWIAKLSVIFDRIISGEMSYKKGV